MREAFSFVVCVNDESFYSRCLKYLQALEIPDGYEIEIKKIVGATSIAAAYDDAMRASDARYKIYLHQDTFVLDPHFLHHLLDIFKSHPEVGMIGAMGGTHLPHSGIWFEDGVHSYGQIMRHGHREGILNRWLPRRLNPDRIRAFRYRPVQKEFLPVVCIDGLMMATQYDIPWRKDLFGGFIYYEGPHCLEFIKRGYEVVVPRQKKPWCLHWGANRTPEEDQKYHAQFRQVMEIFRREYAQFLGKDIDEIRRLLKQGG